MSIHKFFSKARPIVLALSLILSTATCMPSTMAALEEIGGIKADPLEKCVTEAGVTAAVQKLEKSAQDEIEKNAVPGLAIAVVYKDKVVYAKGFGVREAGKEAKIDADTVFQLASVSKPISATVVAALVGEGKINWDSKISDLDPNFKMQDSWVTGQITLRDFYCHRSGWPEHAGDLLEDLGANREQVLSAMRYQTPDTSFRSGYAYTNFGLTEAAVAAAKAYGLTWEQAAEQKLFKPLGMTSTSGRYSDLVSRSDRAFGHVLIDGKWVHKYDRQPDAQSPAGGVSSSVNDMTKWMRLQLGKGKFEGKQVVAEKPLVETHHPHMLTQFNPFNQLPGFYGLGTNVSYDEYGLLRLSHSGGFAMGAATIVTLLPQEELGIVVLTNAAPIGVAEGLAASFIDQALTGKESHDWVAFFKKVFSNPALLGLLKGHDYSKAPASPLPPAKNSQYTGTFHSDFFGNAEVVERDGGLAIVLGPQRMTTPMKHYNRDTFTYETAGENAVGKSGITFTMAPDGTADAMFVEHLNDCGEGSFERIGKENR